MKSVFIKNLKDDKRLRISLQDILAVGSKRVYWPKLLKAVTKRNPPVGLVTRKLGEIYFTVTPTSPGLPNTIFKFVGLNLKLL